MAAGLLVAQAPAAMAADSLTDLGASLGSDHGADVVTGNDKIFVSANDRIVVADAQGALKGTITDLPSVRGLAITPDGTRLYAALRDSKQVAEIDTGSLAITRRIDLTAYLCPSNLALSGGRLYVGYGCSSQNDGGVVSLDVSATRPEPLQIATRLYEAPLIAAAGQKLIVGITGLSPGDFRVYDLSGADATLRGVISGHTHGLSNLMDIAISPDGSTAFSAFGSPHRFDAWDTTNLTLVRSYGVETTVPGYSRAITLSPDGAFVVGGRSTDTSLTVFDTATGEKTFTYENPDVEIVAGSLIFTGRDIFGVVRESSDRLHLWRVPDVTLPTSTLALTAPYTGTALEPFTLTGRLTLSNGSAPGAQPVVLTRQLPDGPREPLAEVTTTADGTFTFTDTPPVVGTIRYDAHWDGSSDFRWSRASTTVTVAKATSTISLAPPSTATAFEPLTLTGRLILSNGAVPGAQRLMVTRQLPTRPRETLPTVTTAADGTFAITDTPSVAGIAKYEVYWPSSSLYEFAIATQSVSVAKAQTVLTLSSTETAVAGKLLEFSGALDSSGHHPSTGRITVLRTVSNRDGTVTTTLPSVPLSGDGSFRFADTPEDGGEYTYTVKWAGDITFMPAEDNHAVTVRGPLG
ncbi:WD40 repeat domain-containing protein [Nonomuraea dietziae]|uniref:WD40 repeat domain-containing protein n=1 Tax=Nonomuraea dietziae TaxID=65515 RepID=UPI0033E3CEC4